MPARTGREYIEGLREQRREVWLRGERVKDVTTGWRRRARDRIAL
jgi:4-hydroxyphenylacetate 3-monooxygenase